ncbi:cholecystokinin receptor type A-like [Ylistrum balloti]|uniref:cholecystokinin receptor type A-like n=1 Tax=Ylistrum balloti TaxID=509963 RepID=UPI002905EB16|nr:cholecystokinin receptor type A-like [Ylistrum balloti]
MNHSPLQVSNNTLTLHEIEWQDFVKKDIPLTVFLSSLSVIGTLGNVMVILTVGRRDRWRNYRILIQCLAFVDLLSCFFSIPGYIALSRFRYSIESDVFCRGTTMFHIFVGAFSVDLLCFIAIERFRKTCRPLKEDFSLMRVKLVCICLAGFNIALATLGLFTFSSQRIMVGNLIGHSCLINKEGTFAKIFSQIIILFLFLKIIVCTVLYCIIGRTLLQHRKHRPHMVPFRYQNSTIKNMSCDHNQDQSMERNNACSVRRMSLKSVTSSDLNSSFQNHGSTRHISSNLSGKTLYTKSAKISFMFLMCTCLSFLSFVPVLVIRCIESFDWQLRADMFKYLGSMAGVLYRFHVLNHVINPIVYCLTNSNFRRDCTDLCKYRR